MEHVELDVIQLSHLSIGDEDGDDVLDRAIRRYHRSVEQQREEEEAGQHEYKKERRDVLEYRRKEQGEAARKIREEEGEGYELPTGESGSSYTVIDGSQNSSQNEIVRAPNIFGFPWHNKEDDQE